jgi:hypothetical protein
MKKVHEIKSLKDNSHRFEYTKMARSLNESTESISTVHMRTITKNIQKLFVGFQGQISVERPEVSKYHKNINDYPFRVENIRSIFILDLFVD